MNDVIAVVGVVISLILFAKFPKLQTIQKSKPIDLKVSVIIPARNEEHNLPGLLSDLNHQSYPPAEIICVNDNSEDMTACVIDRFSAKRIDSAAVPQGWKGKTWACHQGATNASGDVLIFIDADVRLEHTAIEKLIKTHLKHGNPISVQPRHIVRRVYEFFSLFFNLVQVCVTGMSLPGHNRSGFYGPVFLVPRALFMVNGGYAPVKNTVIEDFALGQLYKRNNIEIELFLGGDEITFKMYGSLRALIEGWGKNFSKGAVSLKWWLLILVFIWITSLTAIPIELFIAIANQQLIIIIFYGALYTFSVGALWRAGRAVGSYPMYTFIAYPLFLLGFHLIFIYSILSSFILKTSVWKGRRL